MSWTDGRVALLKKLKREGLSASQIGAQLGVSKNAVLGKLHRLKIADMAPASQVKAMYRRRAATRRPRRPRIDPDLVVIDTSVTGVTMSELEAHHCRWPVGNPKDDDFHYCGRTRLSRGPYCEHHAGHAVQATCQKRPLVLDRRQA